MPCLSLWPLDAIPGQSIMIRRTLSTVVFCSVLQAAAPVTAAEAGVVKTVQGQVRIERAGAVSEAKVGDTLNSGDRVRVRGDGSVGISLKDETLLSLGPNSNFVMGSFNYDPTTRNGQVESSLLKGTLRYVTGFIGRANSEAVKVSTPTATIGIRGTDFIVEVPDGEQ